MGPIGATHPEDASVGMTVPMATDLEGLELAHQR